MVETVEWATDVFMAKAAEQRIALRQRPRRTFTFTHVLTDYQATYARTLVRNAQGDAGFHVPDWTMARDVGAVSSGTGVLIPVDLDSVFIEGQALLWQSWDKYEVLEIALDSNLDSNGVLADVESEYTNALMLPLWEADTPDGLSVARVGASLQEVAINYVLTSDYEIAESLYPHYRDIDVITDCPVLAGGTLQESTAWELSTFDNVVGDVAYIRQRDIPEHTFEMRWLKFSPNDVYTMREFLHARKGRQKAFWLSSRGNDFEVVSVSGTTIEVYNDILARPAGYHIEIVQNGAANYREVTTVAEGAGNAGRPTVELTIDSSVSGSSAERISYLRCARFDADRIELEHTAAAGTMIAVPCREIPEP